MFLNFIKNIMTTKNEDKGKSASELSLKDLKALAVSLKLFTKAEVAKKSQKVLLVAVTKFEKESIAARTAGDKKVLGGAKAGKVSPDLGLYNEKKIVSRTPVELNGKSYVDILVESGETFREPA